VISLHCVLNISGMRIPDNIYITTEAPESELKTDLTAPEYTSFSEFYQHQPNDPQSRFLTPFFFNGHLIPVMVEHHDESTEANSSDENDNGNTYKLYRPSAHENPQFIDMEPPSETQDEPDYYTEKPRKTKKYLKAQEETKKDKKVAKKATEESEEKSDETQTEVENESKEQQQNADDDDHSVEESAPASRLDFQLHGKF
jgi:hypothetical protein